MEFCLKLQRHHSINHTKTWAQITVNDILIPATIIPLHDRSLQSFGLTPFDILVKHSKLQSYTITDTSEIPLSTESATSTPDQEPELNEDVSNFLSHPVSAGENDWSEGADDPPNPDDDPDIPIDTHIDEAVLQQAINLFPRLPLFGQSMFRAMFLWTSGMLWHVSKFQRIMDLPAHLLRHSKMPYSFPMRTTKPRLLHTLQQSIHLKMRCSNSMQNGFGDIASGSFTHLKISFLQSMKSTKHLVHYMMQPIY
jgi:hypothetical protein